MRPADLRRTMRSPLLGTALVVSLAACKLADSPVVPTPRADAAASAGCAAPQRLPPIVEVSVGGMTREAIVRGNATIRQPQPLVLLFHSFAGTGQGLDAETHYARRAVEQGFVAAYPQAVGDPPSWDFASERDVRFVSALLDRLEESLCIDTNRVFVTGMSQGGGMANLAGCRLSDRIAAIAPVAGTYGQNYGDPCEAERPVPVLALHALDDDVVPYAGGAVADGRIAQLPSVMPVENWAADWAARDGCDPLMTERRVSGGTEMSWPGCDAEVRLYRLDAGDHDWPGGPADSAKAISASDLIWEFFSHQALAEAH